MCLVSSDPERSPRLRRLALALTHLVSTPAGPESLFPTSQERSPLAREQDRKPIQTKMELRSILLYLIICIIRILVK